MFTTINVKCTPIRCSWFSTEVHLIYWKEGRTKEWNGMERKKESSCLCLEEFWDLNENWYDTIRYDICARGWKERNNPIIALLCIHISSRRVFFCVFPWTNPLRFLFSWAIIIVAYSWTCRTQLIRRSREGNGKELKKKKKKKNRALSLSALSSTNEEMMNSLCLLMVR